MSSILAIFALGPGTGFMLNRQREVEIGARLRTASSVISCLQGRSAGLETEWR
jgi:hypothetical protein